MKNDNKSEIHHHGTGGEDLFFDNSFGMTKKFLLQDFYHCVLVRKKIEHVWNDSPSSDYINVFNNKKRRK